MPEIGDDEQIEFSDQGPLSEYPDIIRAREEELALRVAVAAGCHKPRGWYAVR